MAIVESQDVKQLTRASQKHGQGAREIYTYRLMASAVFQGSCSSGGGGSESVFTAQKRHPLVQVSPSTMIVPVPPFQHSPMFGHCACFYYYFAMLKPCTQ